MNDTIDPDTVIIFQLIGGQTNGTTYNCTVTARNTEDSGPASSPPVSVTPVTVPGTPTGVTGIAGNTTADLAFTEPTDTGGSAIIDYTATCGGGTDATGAASPLTVTGLTNGTLYNCSVMATNAVSDSPASATVAVTPINSTVDVVDGVQGTVNFAVSGQSLSRLSTAITSGQVPPDTEITYGLINYTVTSPAGGSITVTLTFSEALPDR